MISPHPKYKIREKDTLNGISELFGIAEPEWLYYHNSKCRLSDVIRNGKIPEHLTEILLPPSLWEKEYELNRVVVEEPDIKDVPVKFGIGNSISLKKLPEKSRYRVKIEYPRTRARIDYEMSVEGIEKRPGHLVMKFEKQKFFINRLEPDMVLDEVAVKAAAAIYPLYLDINYLSGRHEILNMRQILESWASTRDLIRKEYAGEIVEKYIQHTEMALQTGSGIYKLMSNDIFFSLFLHSVYGSYDNCYRRAAELRFSPGNGMSALFVGEQQIEPLYNNLSGVFVSFEGQAQMTDKLGNQAKYALHAQYNLQYETFSIMDIIAESMERRDGKEECLTQISIYELRNRDGND